MSSSVWNGRAGGYSSHKNYKYRRLSSAENGAGNGYISCEEDEEEIFTSHAVELKKIVRKSDGQEKKDSSGSSPVRFVSEHEQLIDRPIQSGETLRSISLKYRIPMSELKRINKIFQENEFFALNSLKIPVKPNSVLAEMLDEESKQKQESVASTRAAVLGTRSVSSCSEYESDSEMHVGYISINRILKDTRTKKDAKRFLDNMKRDLAQIREKTSTYKESLDEAAATLTDLRFRPLEQPDKCEGADWGISWWKMMVAAAILLIGIPLLFFWYSNHSS